ncbi:zinc finger protein [Lentzea sp. NPDC042327]|uniref:zinc finger protein n=1 Tax=Lentzea sp. NPDC042327 TaxID=3154801 RepID=UPI0033C69B13
MNTIESGTRAPRLYRWYAHAGERHAIERDLAAGEASETLCGESVASVSEVLAVGFCPTCGKCSTAWGEQIALGKSS